VLLLQPPHRNLRSCVDEWLHVKANCPQCRGLVFDESGAPRSPSDATGDGNGAGAGAGAGAATGAGVGAGDGAGDAEVGANADTGTGQASAFIETPSAVEVDVELGHSIPGGVNDWDDAAGNTGGSRGSPSYDDSSPSRPLMLG